MRQFLIFIAAISVFKGFFTLCFFYRPIEIKWILGSARNLGKPIDSEIFINEKRAANAAIFHTDSNFNKTKKVDIYILYLANTENVGSHRVFIVDKTLNNVYEPNSSTSDYDLFFGNLLQSESGANVLIPLNDSLKGSGFKPKVTINEYEIDFNFPVNEQNTDIRRVKILLK